MGTTLYFAHLIEPLQLNLDHGRYAFHLFQMSQKSFFFKHHAIDGCHFILSLSMFELYYLWVKRYDFGNDSILNCVLERIALYIWGNLGRLGIL